MTGLAGAVPVLALAGYALAVAWLAPAPLARLTRRGLSVRLGLAAWLSALASVAAALAGALCLLIRAVAARWPAFAAQLCRGLAGDACTPAVYRSASYELGLTLAALAVAVALAVVAWRYARRACRSQRQSRQHASAARIVGRALPGTGAVVLDDPRPAAYCVAGRPAAIVVTSGALAVLAPEQLHAVLAHERGHLAGRHHALTLAVRCLAAALPGVPLFARAASEVGVLAEMSADDAAVRATPAGRAAGRALVASALVAIAAGARASLSPATALAAACSAVPARVERMLAAPRRSRQAGNAVVLALITLAAAAAPAVLCLAS